MQGSYLQVRRAVLRYIRSRAELNSQMNGLTPIELMELKPFLVKAMGMIQSLEPRKTEDEDGYGASQ